MVCALCCVGCMSVVALHVIRLFLCSVFLVFFFKQKTAYEMRISDWSSDVCSSDLLDLHRHLGGEAVLRAVEVGLEGHAVVVDDREAVLALGDDVDRKSVV